MAADPSSDNQAASKEDTTWTVGDVTENNDDGADVNADFYGFVYETLAPVLFLLITVVGLLGNGAVVCVIISRRQMRSSTANLLLLNLACSDLCFLTLCVPFVAYHFAADSWRLGEVPCRLFQYVLHVCVYVTVYTLTLIAAFRFLVIVQHARQTARYVTRRVITSIIGVIWITMALVNSPILTLYSVKTFDDGSSGADNVTINDTSKYNSTVVLSRGIGASWEESNSELGIEEEEPYRYCAIVSVTAGQQLFMSFFFMAYIVPLSVICVFYYLIARFLKRRAFRDAVVTTMVAVNNDPDSGVNTTLLVTLQRRSSQQGDRSVVKQGTLPDKRQERTKGATKSRERSARAIRLLLTLVIVFSASWAPLHGLLLAAYFGYQSTSPMYDVFRLAAHCLAYGNSCMNPIVYCYASHEFRQNFRDLCCLPLWRLCAAAGASCCQKCVERTEARRRPSTITLTVRR